MQVIAVGQSKGGVGKTTLAINVAGELVKLGRSVTLVDADPQGCAVQWAEPRKLGFSVRQELVGLRNVSLWIRNVLKTSGDIVIVDMPSGFGITFETAVLISDLVVIPCGPSSLDLNSAKKTILKARESSRVDPDMRLKVVLAPTRVDLETDEGQQISDALTDLGETVSPYLSYDVDYVRSFAAGKPVSTFAPGKPVDREVQALTSFLLRSIPS
ncbi:ParA family protein [Lichenihabitans psoromatis]|uniref:ParA family protein n=1 Tax=Lichenihabitans psoromatis TaxID=2528642 RepID=UPI001036991F|nr:ParA family protein [Lichenihabitans psoromatis]